MTIDRKRLGLAAVTVYVVAFAALYAIACRASLLPPISEVSLSCAFDTAGKRVRFAAEAALWALLVLSPLIIWRATKRK